MNSLSKGHSRGQSAYFYIALAVLAWVLAAGLGHAARHAGERHDHASTMAE